jgi:hypothetical protein
MSLLARCPHCRHEFPIAPRFRGREVACVSCDERFDFADGPELPDADEEYVVEVPAEETAEPEINVELVPVSRRGSRLRRAAGLFLLCILPAIVTGPAVYAWHRWKAGPADSGGPPADELGWPVVDVPAGFDADRVLTLHVYGAEDGGDYLAVMQRPGSLAEPSGTGGTRGVGSGGRMTIRVAPVRDPRAAARKIDFGVVESVRGRVITVRANLLPGLPPGADAVDRALLALQNQNPAGRLGAAFGQRQAIQTLMKAPADHRRKAVADVLARALGDRDLAFGAGDEILAGLGVWGTEDSVPAIENYMWDSRLNPFLHNGLALRALAKIGGKRALAVVLRAFDEGRGFDRPMEFGDPMLGEPFDIKMAITAFGPAAEDAVLERFVPRNVGVYVTICQILREIGTRKSIPLLEAAVAKNSILEPHARAAAQSIRARGN